MEIKYLLRRSAKYYKNDTCVVCGPKHLTYQEVNDRATRFANSLLALGMKVGDRVCILLNNSEFFVEIYWALPLAGFTRVPLNNRDSSEEHVFKITNCQASTLVFGEPFSDFVVANFSQLSCVKHFICIKTGETSVIDNRFLDYEKMLMSCNPNEISTEIPGNTIYRMTHTGGTTGRPKPVVMTYTAESELFANMLLNVMPFQRDDVFLHVHPLSHGTACFMVPAIIRGAKQIIIESAKPEVILEAVQEEAITSTWLVPATIIRLISFPEIATYNLRSLRRLLYGGAPMPLARLREALEVFGPIMAQHYGQAEIPFCATFLPPEDHVLEGSPNQVRRLSSCGRELDRTMVRVVDERGNDMPTGQVGEIVAKSSHMMAGYWNNPHETAEAMKNGWVHTRDMGWMDEDGYIYLVDRKSEMVISGGFNVYPKEIEDVLHFHPSVQEAAVIGVPDSQWGEAVKGLVVLKEGKIASEDELIDHCKKHLGKYKVPKSIDILAGEIPKTPVGKIDKQAFKKQFWKGYDRQIH
jgi:long-chain acyl-CoA synthetase